MKYYIDDKEYSSLETLTDAMTDIAETEMLLQVNGVDILWDFERMTKAREEAEYVASWFGPGEELEYGGFIIWDGGRVIKSVPEFRDLVRALQEVEMENPWNWAILRQPVQ